MSKVLYNFASRSRPEKLINCIENILSLAEEPDYEIIVTLDVDDPAVTGAAFNDRLKAYPHVRPIYGFSKNKIDAINKNIWASEGWGVLINMSDDMLFTAQGFDKRITSAMTQHFPDSDGVLHYPDGSPAGNLLATMSIMGRRYYDRFNYVYHPDYENVYCDNEFTDVAKKLGKYVFIDEQILVHNHPIWGKSEMDDQYRLTENPQGYARDHATFERRRQNNFDL